MPESQAKFSVGQLVHHQRFGYRGVIVDADACFEGSDEWYRQVARSRPPKDEPWYHILPHDELHTTYVAERNLEPDTSSGPIRHPLLAAFFEDFRDGRYVAPGRVN